MSWFEFISYIFFFFCIYVWQNLGPFWGTLVISLIAQWFNVWDYADSKMEAVFYVIFGSIFWGYAVEWLYFNWFIASV